MNYEIVSVNMKDKEKLYQVYKELRDDGILWLDPKAMNLGRLNSPNIAHFNTDPPFHVENESVGIIKSGSEKAETLQKGDLVIIDSDLIVRESEFPSDELIEKYRLYRFMDYERRYQLEKAAAKAKAKAEEPDISI